MKKNNYKLLLVLPLIGLMTLPTSGVRVLAEDPILVGEATNLEEKLTVATNELTLNIDLDNVVTSMILPNKGLYGAVVSYTSDSDYLEVSEDNSLGTVIRPEKSVGNVVVHLTALVSIKESKDSFGTKEKIFTITILARNDTNTEKQEMLIDEDFTSYATGSELSEYLPWNLASGSEQARVVESVPNNNKVGDGKVLEITSKKSASVTSYVRDFYTTNNVAFEGYMMYTGQLNTVSFELGRNGSYGPSIYVNHNGFSYYKNGLVAFKAEDNVKPREGVWYKFRIETNTSLRMYSLKVYRMDGANSVYVACTNVAYSGTAKYLSQLRIRVQGGDNSGKLYAAALKIDNLASFDINEGINPNRTNGIGDIGSFEDSIMMYSDETYVPSDIVVHNRFKPEEVYQKDTDYSLKITNQVISEKEQINKYLITLLSTGETKELTQMVYIEERNGLPEIEEFKCSHLARTIIDESTGALSSTATIKVSGRIRRRDSKIYYVVTKANETAPTVDEIIAQGTNFVKKGVVEQTTSNISIDIPEMAINSEYNAYVVAKNDNGCSPIYVKNDISEVINITTCDEFYDMTVNVNTYKNEFRLLNDLDFSNYNWISDENNNLKFQGSLDGNGHVIKNLKITSPYRKAAIFFEITNATIKDLVIDNALVQGLQDSAVLVGYSNGGTIENVTFRNPRVEYNNNDGSEGYFAIVVGRLHKDTTTMKNIIIENGNVVSNKYCGVLTGNVNKGNNCVLNATNIYADCRISCEGAAVGLVGRNRGTLNVENAFVNLTIATAKKEMGTIAGHNKEGGVLNAKKIIGRMEVLDCTQPTYFNNFIGSHDPNTSSYTFEDCYFFDVDYSEIFDSRVPVVTARTAGTLLSDSADHTQRWYEENTYIGCFEVDPVWDFDEVNQRPVLNFNKEVNIKAEDVNKYIDLIKDDYSSNDHYYIKKAYTMYNAASSSEKTKINYEKLSKSKEKYDAYIASIESIASGFGGY